jgi:hypothetical protein
MQWVVEPFVGFRLSMDITDIEEPASCEAGGSVLHCGCIVGLKTCNCNGGLTVGQT